MLEQNESIHDGQRVNLRDATSRARQVAEGLYPHQVAGVGFLLGRRRSILADDMGLGKTRQSVIALTEAEPRGPYLVVCPASVKHNWAREIRLALGDAEIAIVGPDRPPQAGFDGWVIVNYDILKRDIEALLEHVFTGFVFDEAHYLRNHRTIRSRMSRRLVDESPGAPAVHVLTGTPLTNRPRDLFPLLQLVEHALGRSFLAFAKRYCDGHKNDYGYWVTTGASNIEELALQLQGIMLRRTKDEVLDLPAKQRTWIELDVPDNVGQSLNESVARFLGDSRDSRGRRINAGLFSRARRRIAIAKVPQTLEYVRGAIDQGEKVILYSHSTGATRRFAEQLGDQAVVLTGAVPTPKRQGLIDRFQNDESIRVFIGQIHAAGIGINLTAANLVVFNDLDWVPANHWQAEDRAHRIGQKRSVNVTYMIARGTIEEFVRTVLERKSRLVDDLIEGKSLGESMEGDLLDELKGMMGHLDTTLEATTASVSDPDALAQLLQTATDRYIADHEARLPPRTRRALKPVSESAIRALAAVLAGPERAVYTIASASNASASHRIEVEGADISCDCTGFSYRGMCRHVRDLKNAIATGTPIPPEYVRQP